LNIGSYANLEGVWVYDAVVDDAFLVEDAMEDWDSKMHSMII